MGSRLNPAPSVNGRGRLWRAGVIAAAAAVAFWLGNRYGPRLGGKEAGSPFHGTAGALSEAGAFHDDAPVDQVLARLSEEAQRKGLGGAAAVLVRKGPGGGFLGYRDKEADGDYVAFHITEDGAGGAWIRPFREKAEGGGAHPLPEDLPALGELLWVLDIDDGHPGKLAVFRMAAPRQGAQESIHREFCIRGWSAGRTWEAQGVPESAVSSGAPVLLYTKGRRRCLVSLDGSDAGESGCDVMVLCDR